MVEKIARPSKGRDKWSDDQKDRGQRIKSIAWNLGLGLKELHALMSKHHGVTANQDAFEHTLNGRETALFTRIVDAAVEVLVEKQDERDNKNSRSNKQEIDLKKRALRHFILEGDLDLQYELHELEAQVQADAVAKIEQEAAKAGWKLERCDWGKGLSNPDFNRRLLLSPPKIAVQKEDQEWLAHNFWHPDISGFVVSEARKKSIHLSDDQKIRIGTDFIEASKVVLQPTRYFSSLATDQIAWFRFSTSKTKADGTPEDVLWDGVTAFVDEETRGMKRFEKCGVSNQLGASVMALTQDGEMLVVHQNRNNHQSGGRLAPSGSGSLDWTDVGERRDFLEVVRSGAKRELQEECALVDNKASYRPIDCAVLLTGFVRMVHRAGKPEFFGLARVEGTAEEICKRKPERYVEKVFNAPIEKADWRRPASLQIAKMCRSYLDRHTRASSRIPLSYPLQHLLIHLVEVCEDPARAKVIDAFMERDR